MRARSMPWWSRAYSAPHLGELHEPLGGAVDGGPHVEEERRGGQRARDRRHDGRPGDAPDPPHAQQGAGHGGARVAGADHGRRPGRRAPPRRSAPATSPSSGARSWRGRRPWRRPPRRGGAPRCRRRSRRAAGRPPAPDRPGAPTSPASGGQEAPATTSAGARSPPMASTATNGARRAGGDRRIRRRGRRRADIGHLQCHVPPGLCLRHSTSTA